VLSLELSSGVVICDCHLGLSSEVVIEGYYSGLSSGVVIGGCHLGLYSRGCHLGLSSGVASGVVIQGCHPRLSFGES
jgi:hypothetical protein